MAPSSPTADAWTGRLVGGRWRIVSLLNDSGGMASVYLARDERLDWQAVVKMPKGSHLNAEFAERFAREAKWHAKVENLHVVHILDRGEEAGTPFLVLQYLPGGNLKAWCERNPSILADPRPQRPVRLGGDGLSGAHRVATPGAEKKPLGGRCC